MAVIRKRANGRYQALIRKAGFPHQSKTFEKRTDAKAWASVIESTMVRGQFVHRSDQDMTLAQALEKYKAEVTPTKKGHKEESYKIGALLRDPLAAKMLHAIKPPDVAQLRDQLEKSGLSGSSVLKRLALLSHVYTTARREWGVVTENPVLLVRKPRPARGRERRLRADEEAYLLGAFSRTFEDLDVSATWVTHQGNRRNPNMEPLVRLALSTAARQGELLKLRWGDVDLQNRTATFRDTKNGRDRTIPLSADAWVVLKNWQLAQHRPGTQTPVFNTTASSVSQAWERAVIRARRQYEADCGFGGKTPDPHILADLRFHDLRHEAVSRLFEKGLNVVEVASISGHQSLQMLSRYTHLSPSELLKKLG